jgi:hypothetical protein
MDEAFVNSLRTELFNQYNTLDAVSEYIAVKEGIMDMYEHGLKVMDVRLEPLYDRVVVHYTVVVDRRVLYRTSYPMLWEVLQKVKEEFKTVGHNPWTMQTFRNSPRRVNEMEKVSGPALRVITPEEAAAILQKQVVDPLAK